MGFRKADDFYIALGQSKITTKVVTNKLMQRLKAGGAVADDAPLEGLVHERDDDRTRRYEASDFGIKVKGVDDVAVRLAKCCTPVPGDEIVGYVSLGRGIVHREDCRNLKALKRRERFTDVGGDAGLYRVELQVDAWDRTRLLEDLSRLRRGRINISEPAAPLHPMVKNCFVVGSATPAAGKRCGCGMLDLRQVFDAYGGS
jgi:GTP pyrophosphokinase